MENPRGMGMDGSEKPPVCEACGRPVTERSKVNGAWLKSHRGCKDRIRTIRRRRAAEENEERLEAMFLEALEDRKRAANQWRWQIENRNELADEHDRVLAATLLVSYRCMIAAMNVMPSALIQYREPWAVDLTRMLGRRTVALIARRDGWTHTAFWEHDPECGEDGTLTRVGAGEWALPMEGMEDEYRDDLDHEDGRGRRTFSDVKALQRLWAEDHVGGQWDPGPWRFK